MEALKPVEVAEFLREEMYVPTLSKAPDTTFEEVKGNRDLYVVFAGNIASLPIVKKEYKEALYDYGVEVFGDGALIQILTYKPSINEVFIRHKRIGQLSENSQQTLQKEPINSIKNIFLHTMDALVANGYYFPPQYVEHGINDVVEDRIHANANSLSLITGVEVIAILKSAEQDASFARFLMAMKPDATRVLAYFKEQMTMEEAVNLWKKFGDDIETALRDFTFCFGDHPIFLYDCISLLGVDHVIEKFKVLAPHARTMSEMYWLLGKQGINITSMNIQSIEDFIPWLEVYEKNGERRSINYTGLSVLARYHPIKPEILSYNRSFYELIGRAEDNAIHNINYIVGKETFEESIQIINKTDMIDKLSLIIAILNRDFGEYKENILHLRKFLQFYGGTSIENLPESVIDLLTKQRIHSYSSKQLTLLYGLLQQDKIDTFSFWVDFVSQDIGKYPYESIVVLLKKKLYPTPSLLSLYEQGEKDFDQLDTKDFDIQDPLSVDVQYYNYRKTVDTLDYDKGGLSDYALYINRVENLKKGDGKINLLSYQEKVKQSAIESGIASITIKHLLNTRYKPAKIFSNWSYGKAITAPIGNKIEDTDIEPIKIGSTECHGRYFLFIPTLFSDRQIKDILKNNMDLFVLDGTKGESFPDSNIGFKSFLHAINQALYELGNKNAEIDPTIHKGISYDEDFRLIVENIKILMERNAIKAETVKPFAMKYIGTKPNMQLKTRGIGSKNLIENDILDDRYNYLFYIDPVIRGTKDQAALDDTSILSGLTLNYDENGLTYIYKDLIESMKPHFEEFLNDKDTQETYPVYFFED